MASFAQFGNDLYTGRRQINFIGRRKLWYGITAVLLLIAALGLFGRGLNLSLEFSGGAELKVRGVTNTQNFDTRAQDAVHQATGTEDNLIVTKLGDRDIRIQTEKLGNGTAAATEEVRGALAKEFGVPAAQIDSQFIGPSWGETVTRKAVQALLWFLALLSVVLALYFRTWKMALAAIVAVIHDLFFTVGIYALTGFEVSPATMIGFLTILGYSIYDTVVVFDKVRENTHEAFVTGQRNYDQAANYAVNQTLVRSINTTVVALLPIGAILVVGFTMLGPGTLLDLSLSLFIGIAVGAYSSIFIATPLLADLRRGEPAIKELAARAKAYQTSQRAALTEADTPRATPGESASGVVEPERAAAAAAARATRTKKRETHPLARLDRDRDR
ncbi:protein translocase subunit SecF [Luteipulveratus sp. YIM 133132]|uniref:Protein-export membrane protein SecF n=1 Tax=Luteipulveratus flavus TaxID=3031728 RepID=A0ABT6CBZ7_9MICO|nr:MULTISPECIES: protein translocase subunit SecF [unclassified Luteipulveratus]MDE9367330.1 protein translocase subunit SecF [Luteipulveratus sp. YIM 133132]MDF8266286.1 protein translocase subunit SecF [Luteipulveratus sp. YIM 133296]